MRLIQYISEEYFARYDRWEIFKNPSIRDLKKIGDKKIRFIADNKDKSFYVWKFDLLHWDAWRLAIKKKLNDKRKYDNHVFIDLFPGRGVLLGNSIKILNSDALEMYGESLGTDCINLPKEVNKKFEWTKKYLKNFDEWISDLEEYFISYLGEIK